MNTRMFVDTAANDAAQEAWKRYMHGPMYQKLYVYFRPGHLDILSEDETPVLGSALAINEAIPMHATREQMFNWIRFRLGNVPFLPANIDSL